MKFLGKTKFQVLQDPPNVLSIGKLVRENNIAFRWPVDGPPYFETLDGHILKLKVNQDVPYFSEGDVRNLIKTATAPKPSDTTNPIEFEDRPLAPSVKSNSRTNRKCFEWYPDQCGWCGTSSGSSRSILNFKHQKLEMP